MKVVYGKVNNSKSPKNYKKECDTLKIQLGSVYESLGRASVKYDKLEKDFEKLKIKYESLCIRSGITPKVI